MGALAYHPPQQLAKRLRAHHNGNVLLRLLLWIGKHTGNTRTEGVQRPHRSVAWAKIELARMLFESLAATTATLRGNSPFADAVILGRKEEQLLVNDIALQMPQPGSGAATKIATELIRDFKQQLGGSALRYEGATVELDRISRLRVVFDPS